MKNNKLFLFLMFTLCLFFVQCKDEDQIVVEQNEIDAYLSSELKESFLMINESAYYGVFNGSGIDEMCESGIEYYSNLSGFDSGILKDGLVDFKLKSSMEDTMSDSIVDDILNSEVKNELVVLFSVFDKIDTFYELTENNEEIFKFDEFSVYATSFIIKCENDVLNSIELSDTDKAVYFSSSFILKDVLCSFESLSIYLSENFGRELKSAYGFFKKLWEGVKKVTSVIVSTTVSTVINVFGSLMMGTGMDGVIDNIFCTIPGVFYGLYYGIVVGVECDAFDFDCMLMSDNYKMACNGGY